MSALFSATALVVPFENLRMTDVEAVGGKNASLGEMISQLPQGVKVPTGFATTAHAFRQFLAHAGLADRIQQRLADAGHRGRARAGRGRRRDPRLARSAAVPADLEREIRAAFEKLQAGNRRPASPCARRPPPKTCPMPRSPASRRPS
jgi:pyruvate,water dikinase